MLKHSRQPIAASLFALLISMGIGRSAPAQQIVAAGTTLNQPTITTNYLDVEGSVVTNDLLIGSAACSASVPCPPAGIDNGIPYARNNGSITASGIFVHLSRVVMEFWPN